MAQQTAVDYLVNLYYTEYDILLPSEDFAKAKQMEKEQIENAWEDGKGSFSTRFPEQYYNETFTSTPQGENPSATRTEQF